jgi:hypothetical protein
VAKTLKRLICYLFDHRFGEFDYSRGGLTDARGTAVAERACRRCGKIQRMWA